MHRPKSVSFFTFSVQGRRLFFHNLEIFSVEFRGAERRRRANFPLFKIPKQWSYAFPVFPILHMSGRNFSSLRKGTRPRQEQQQQLPPGQSRRISQDYCYVGFFFLSRMLRTGLQCLLSGLLWTAGVCPVVFNVHFGERFVALSDLCFILKFSQFVVAGDSPQMLQ